MSVRGEFRRCLGDCLASLETAAGGDVAGWRDALHAARVAAEEDLSAGAERWLEELEGRRDAPPRFGVRLEGERFEELVEHLGAVCRVILGR